MKFIWHCLDCNTSGEGGNKGGNPYICDTSLRDLYRLAIPIAHPGAFKADVRRSAITLEHPPASDETTGTVEVWFQHWSPFSLPPAKSD